MLMMLLSCLICLVTIYGLFCTLFLRVSKRSDYHVHVREQTNIIAASANDLRELYYCISVYPPALGFGRCGLLCRADTPYCTILLSDAAADGRGVNLNEMKMTLAFLSSLYRCDTHVTSSWEADLHIRRWYLVL